MSSPTLDDFNEKVSNKDKKIKLSLLNNLFMTWFLKTKEKKSTLTIPNENINEIVFENDEVKITFSYLKKLKMQVIKKKESDKSKSGADLTSFIKLDPPGGGSNLDSPLEYEFWLNQYKHTKYYIKHENKFNIISKMNSHKILDPNSTNLGKKSLFSWKNIKYKFITFWSSSDKLKITYPNNNAINENLVHVLGIINLLKFDRTDKHRERWLSMLLVGGKPSGFPPLNKPSAVKQNSVKKILTVHETSQKANRFIKSFRKNLNQSEIKNKDEANNIFECNWPLSEGTSRKIYVNSISSTDYKMLQEETINSYYKNEYCVIAVSQKDLLHIVKLEKLDCLFLCTHQDDYNHHITKAQLKGLTKIISNTSTLTIATGFLDNSTNQFKKIWNIIYSLYQLTNKLKEVYDNFELREL